MLFKLDPREMLVLALLALLGTASLTGVYLYPPAESAYYPRCAFYDATGLHCPGCGGFRAWHALLHGRWIEALQKNALAVTLVPLLLLWYGRHRFYLGKSHFWTTGLSRPVLWLLLVAVIAFAALRNLPDPPFHWFSP